MKKKNLLISASLALGVGVGVFAGIGLHNGVAEVDEVKAETIYSSIYLKGGMNGWCDKMSNRQIVDTYGTAYQFRYVGLVNSRHTYQLTAEFTANNQEFKIHDQEHENSWVNTWDSSKISSDVLGTSDGGDVNVICKTAGTYTITYSCNTDGGDRKITGFDAPVALTAADEIKEWSTDFLSATETICSDNGTENNQAELEAIWKDNAGTAGSYVLKGTFDGWGSGLAMKQVGSSSLYRISDLFLVNGDEFKVNDGGEGWWPASNYVINGAGYYKIEFDRSADDGKGALTSVAKFQYLDASYGRLSADAKSLFVKGSSDDTVANAFARYAHIVTRYGLNNFASKDLAGARTVNKSIESNNNTVLAITVTAASIALLGTAGFFLLRRRKEN